MKPKEHLNQACLDSKRPPQRVSHWILWTRKRTRAKRGRDLASKQWEASGKGLEARNSLWDVKTRRKSPRRERGPVGETTDHT